MLYIIVVASSPGPALSQLFNVFNAEKRLETLKSWDRAGPGDEAIIVELHV